MYILSVIATTSNTKEAIITSNGSTGTTNASGIVISQKYTPENIKELWKRPHITFNVYTYTFVRTLA